MKKYLKFIFCFLLAQLSFWCLVVRDGYAQAQARYYSTLYGTINIFNVGLMFIPLLFAGYALFSLTSVIKKLRKSDKKAMFIKFSLGIMYILFALVVLGLIFVVRMEIRDFLHADEIYWVSTEVILLLLCAACLFLSTWGIKKINQKEKKGLFKKILWILLNIICSIPLILISLLGVISIGDWI